MWWLYFNLLRKCHSVSYRGCTVLHSDQELEFLLNPTKAFFFLFSNGQPNQYEVGSHWDLTVICMSIMINGIEYLFI